MLLVILFMFFDAIKEHTYEGKLEHIVLCKNHMEFKSTQPSIGNS